MRKTIPVPEKNRIPQHLKTSFIQLIRDCLPDYGQQYNAETLKESKGHGKEYLSYRMFSQSFKTISNASRPAGGLIYFAASASIRSVSFTIYAKVEETSGILKWFESRLPKEINRQSCPLPREKAKKRKEKARAKGEMPKEGILFKIEVPVSTDGTFDASPFIQKSKPLGDYLRDIKLFSMSSDELNAELENFQQEQRTKEHQTPSFSKQMNTEIQNLLKSNLQVILTGAPGTGKTYMAKKVAEAIVTEGISPDDVDARKKAMDECFQSVQFHPGYDYSDFVIGMKPEIVNGANGSKAVSFDWHDGVFKTFADIAREEYDNAKDKAKSPKFVFLIDEINRSDLSRVFGELFSLLEEEYRYPNNKKGVMLPNGKAFVIPRNLFIIGTMNDIDRSVESMDFALRRRFAWKEVRAKDTQKDIFDAKKPDGSAKIDPVDAEKLKKAMDALNFEIAGEEVDGKKPTLDLRLGPEYELGGAIFAQFEKCGDFKDLWRNHIEIILNEYLRGRKEKNALLTSLNGLFFESVGMAAT